MSCGRFRLNSTSLVGLALLTCQWGCGPSGGNAPPGTLGRTSPASSSAAELSTAVPSATSQVEPSFVGVVLSREAADIAPQVGGRVDEIRLSLGDRVAPGDIIARLDASAIRRELAVSRATLKGAQADRDKARLGHEEAKKRFERRQSLPDAYSREQREAAKFALQKSKATMLTAKSEVGKANARIAQLRGELEQSVLRAPFGGTVEVRYVDRGAMVTAGQPLLRLVSEDGLRVRFAVPPEHTRKLAVGRAIAVTTAQSSTTVAGKISHIAKGIDAASQLVFVEASLDIAKSQSDIFRVGAVARVELD